MVLKFSLDSERSDKCIGFPKMYRYIYLFYLRITKFIP